MDHHLAKTQDQDQHPVEAHQVEAQDQDQHTVEAHQVEAHHQAKSGDTMVSVKTAPTPNLDTPYIMVRTAQENLPVVLERSQNVW